MSEVSDSTPVRTVGQGKLTDKMEIVNYERALMINQLLSWLVSIVTSEAMRTLGIRVTGFVKGGYLPGKVDMTALAALTGKPEETIKDVMKGRSRFKVGGTAYYPIDEVAIPYELPVEVERAKRKAVELTKNTDKSKENRKAP